jgi:hypothetical protein
MKLIDVDKNINEDLGDWLKNAVAKTGIMGSTAQLSARQREVQERIYNTGLKFFKNQLDQSLNQAVKTGFVTTKTQAVKPNTIAQATSQSGKSQTDTGSQVTPGSKIVIPKTGYSQNIKTQESRQFSLLSELMESKILNEQQTVGGFIRDFVSGQTDEFAPNPEFQQFLDTSIKKAEQEFTSTGKISDRTYEQLWSTIFNWSRMGGQKSRSGYSSRRNAPRDANNNGIPDDKDRDTWHTKLTGELNKLNPNEPQDIVKMGEIGQKLVDFFEKNR